MSSSSQGETSPPPSPVMSFTEDVSRVSTPDIIIDSADLQTGAGFNLADELAMAEEEGLEGHITGRLSPTKSALSGRSDYEGSEYGNIDDDSDGYLDGRVDMDELELQGLVEEVSGGKEGVINRFVQDLRGMRGQMDVENNARRLITMQRSLASALDHHLRLLRDVPILSPLLLQDDTFVTLLTNLALPSPVVTSSLLEDLSFDLTGLSDTLTMSRQEHLQTTRRLRTVKDAWIERKDQWDVLEASMEWLAEHDNMVRRPRGSCAREVQAVVRGFDKVLLCAEQQMYSAPFIQS